VFVALWLFLGRTELGIAIRGGAERADRAASLGIPVRRLHTVVWVLATVLAFLAVYLRAGIVGLPIGEVLGPAVLLRALAAAVIGRMERMPTIAVAAVVLGVVEQSVLWHWQTPAYVDPVLFVVVLGALLVTRGVTGGRAGEQSTWQAAREVRPVPRELAALPEVRAVRWGIPVAAAAFLISVPAWLGDAQVNLAAVILIFAIIGLSLVVLTGWAGQVSLGQMAFVGVGAAVGGAVTDRLGWDLSFALVLGGLAGALVAVVIGLPALRRRGLTLAVTTLAFALMTSSWLLNRRFFGAGNTIDWLPPERITRPPLFGAIAVDTETRYYYLCVVGLALAYAMVRGLRRSRTGRVLIAIRENERTAEAFGVSARTTLLAFAFSGFLAAFAGALFVHQQSGLDLGPYLPTESLKVFSMTVIGGLGAASGAVVGATYVRGVQYYVHTDWVRVLLAGGGLLFVLLPGGFGAALADTRDRLLRLVAARRGIRVPSLVADTGDETPAAADLVTAPRDEGDRAAALLAARGVCVAYDGVQVLFGVDLEVAEGEIVALLGTNGAGKSTFLRAVGGLVDVTAGSITFAGDELTGARPEAVARRRVASVPGGQGTFPSLTVAEHLRLAGWTRRGDPGLPAATDHALDQFPQLRERLDAPAGDLSGGQQQMLTVAMALVSEPRLLLLDELSLGLAPSVVAELLRVVRGLAARGTTIILVEQSVNLALEVADRAYFMEKGAVRFAGLTADLLARPDILRSVFLEHARAAPASVNAPAVPADSTRRGTCLEVRGLSKHYGGVDALRDVALTVADGEIVGVLGPNGAGKTTLFDVVGGFERADAGTVVLHDDGRAHDLTHLAPAARARLGLDRSFQDARLFPALTVAETIAVALDDETDVHDPVAAALHLPHVYDSEAAVAARVDELIARFGLDAYRDKFGHELSTGTRRIVDLACVVARKPRVVLLDEPSSGIAQREAEALAPLLRRVRDELGPALVVIEHDLPLLQAVADRLVALDLGAVIAMGSPDAVIHDPRVVAAYLGTDDAAIARSGGRRADTEAHRRR
jgi:ABC-type branched-subunit amino acid transport system ATPase component/ABC-type branched-subunit amino acid transport system permease subunit